MDAWRLRRHQSSKSGHPLNLAGRETKNNTENINTEEPGDFLKSIFFTKRKGRYLNATISETDTFIGRDQLIYIYI